jgi:hypothetical protein
LAIEGHCPTLPEVVESVRSNEIPLAFTGLRGRFAQFYAAGWKLAHIEDVGLGTRERLENIPIAALEDHFRKLVLPSNMFAIPKVWAGLGEVPEIIEAIRTCGEHERPLSIRAPSVSRSAGTPRASAGGEEPYAADARPGAGRGNRAASSNTYRATRLLFKASVIERLSDDQPFRIETPEGTYEMTRAQFRRTFANVADSDTYKRTGVYSYNRTPEKALRYLLPLETVLRP